MRDTFYTSPVRPLLSCAQLSGDTSAVAGETVPDGLPQLAGGGTPGSRGHTSRRRGEGRRG